MRIQTILIGVVALVFSISAAATAYLVARQPGSDAEVQTVQVVVTTTPVARGVSLTADVLTTIAWPKDHVPQNALTLEDAIGRTVWIPLIPNEPVVELKLASLGAGRGLAALVPQGMRAVTIQTPNVATGVAGFILPGNKVDVLWTSGQSNRDDYTGGGSTITLLQNIEILAVDQQMEAPQENKVDLRDLRSVTLLVSPEDASKLDLGQNRGTLRLSLRNPEDALLTAFGTTTMNSLRSHTSPGYVVRDAAPEDVEEIILNTAPPESARAAEIVLPIRTLRGTSGGTVYFRQRRG